MPHKKRIFSKHNSTKFLLIHGHTEAINADGKALENVLVPVSKNYKPGTSLIMPGLAALCNADVTEGPSEEPDMKKIMDQFDDSESDDEDDGRKNLPSKLKKLTIDQREKSPSSNILQIEECECSDSSNECYDVSSQFSDTMNDSFEDDINIQHSKTIDYRDCPENLKIFNEQFGKFFEKEYDEDQIGALDDEEICGHLSTDCERFQNLFDPALNPKEELIVLGPCDEEIKEKILNLAEDSGDEKIVEIVTERPLEFDCESILSTYSNKYNHPTVIKEGKVTKIRIPNNPMKKSLTRSQLKTLDIDKESDDESDDNVSISTAFNARVKGETPEERRDRKKLFKEAKRESRILKKENKLSFKKEKKLQTAQNLNKQRTSGIKLL